jgi:hypothetical protein
MLYIAIRNGGLGNYRVTKNLIDMKKFNLIHSFVSSRLVSSRLVSSRLVSSRLLKREFRFCSFLA